MMGRKCLMELQTGQTYKLFVKVIDKHALKDRFGNIYYSDIPQHNNQTGNCLMISARIDKQSTYGDKTTTWYDITDMMVLESFPGSKLESKIKSDLKSV
jgi:hypothetical protein